MLEMLHIHIPFLCFPRPSVFSEYLSPMLCKTHKVGPALSCLCLCGNMYWGIFMIFIRFHILTRNGAAQITDNNLSPELIINSKSDQSYNNIMLEC